MNEVHSRRDRADRRPTAFLFWSLKHPEEVATLRHVYGGSFHLVALYATEEDRIAELAQRSGVDEDAARQHVERDREEPRRDRGQRTRDTFHLADVFLEWKPLLDEAGLRRFVQILFGRPDLTPTATEHRMFLAYVSALRSGELSRQVGAVLVSKDGDVLAVGANDVPRSGGGLHWPDAADDRDAVRGEDANTVVRGRLLAEVARSVAAEVGADEAKVARALEGSRLKEITEYGRAVHAEMEALLACARSGTSTRRTTLFVTTYPCHDCARHIVAAGVERVVFVEPYPKSRALELHDKDVLEVPPGGEGMAGRVRFEPYLGIGPRRFFDYFSMSLGSGYELRRKDGSGKLQRWDPATAAPRVQRPELPLPEQEKLMAAPLVDLRIDRT